MTNMTKEDQSLEFKLKKIDETRNYLLEEIKHNVLMSKKHEKTFITLNYVEDFLTLASKVTGCVSISAFALLVEIPIGITSSEATIKTCVITAEIKKYMSIIKKRSKCDKIVLLGRVKLNAVEVLISKALINSYITHDKFVSVNIVLREYNETKKEVKNPKMFVEYTI